MGSVKQPSECDAPRHEANRTATRPVLAEATLHELLNHQKLPSALLNISTNVRLAGQLLLDPLDSLTQINQDTGPIYRTSSEIDQGLPVLDEHELPTARNPPRRLKITQRSVHLPAFGIAAFVGALYGSTLEVPLTMVGDAPHRQQCTDCCASDKRKIEDR